MAGIVAPPQPQVYVRGPIPTGQVDYARSKVAGAFRIAPRPVLFVRLSIEKSADPGGGRPYTVRVHADVSGVDLHARASAPTVTEAADLVQRRLRALLARTSRWR
jgi:ribosome-associated translation inhibitor RaiA